MRDSTSVLFVFWCLYSGQDFLWFVSNHILWGTQSQPISHQITNKDIITMVKPQLLGLVQFFPVFLNKYS